MTETTARPTSRRPLLTVLFVGAAVLAVAGTWPLRDSPIGADILGAFGGVGSQLRRTGPAALLIAAMTALDLLVGSLVVRTIRGRPYSSRIDAVGFGLAGAILLNTFTLALFGSVGLFTAPVLAVTYVVVGVVCWRLAQPMIETTAERTRFPIGFWVFLVVAWSGPLILQLASPVVPFRDVLHNHIAPVEFVRTYHWFPDLFTSPAPETGPTRQFLGYIGLESTLVKLTGLPAVLAVAAFALPLTVLTAIAVFRLAEHVIGRGTGMWALAVMPLSFVFLRLPDGRATDVAAVLVMVGLLPLGELDPRRRVLVRALVLAAVIYVHPLLGLFNLGVHALLAIWFGSKRSSDEADFPIAAVPAAIVFALPQLQLAAGLEGPIWIVLIALPLGVAASFIWSRVRFPERELAMALAAAGIVAALIGATTILPKLWSAVADVANLYPLTVAGFVLYVAVARKDKESGPYLLIPLAVGLVAYAVANLLPDNTEYWRNTGDEVTGKVAQYWSPTFFVLGTSGALAWAWGQRTKVIARPLVAVFMIAAVLPLRSGTVDIEENRERRVAETLSIDLHKAEMGAWTGWADTRRLVGDSQRELIDVFRREQDAGRMTRKTQTIHVAASRWTWVSTPVGAFAGVYETHFSEEPDVSGHTLGGRLHSYSELPGFLNVLYPYALLEPDGVPDEVRNAIVRTGYRSIFRNGRGEIFRRKM